MKSEFAGMCFGGIQAEMSQCSYQLARQYTPPLHMINTNVHTVYYDVSCTPPKSI